MLQKKLSVQEKDASGRTLQPRSFNGKGSRSRVSMLALLCVLEEGQIDVGFVVGTTSQAQRSRFM